MYPIEEPWTNVLTDRAHKVSVLMPSFNYARYLPQAIESVLSQSYADLELIISDDCSTDGSREIADEWKRRDHRVVTVFHKANRGVSAARNSALAVATGAFIALCDADDVWLSDKLRIQLEILRSEPRVGVVHSDSVIIDGEGTPTGQRFSTLFHGRRQKCSGMIFDDLCLRNFVCNPTVILRRECMELAGGFEERVKAVEDWFCWALIAKKYPFYYIDAPLVGYRIHGANLSSKTSAMARARVMAISLLLAESSEIPSSIKAKMLYSMGMSHLEIGDCAGARSSFLSALREDVFSFRAWARWAQAACGSLMRAERDTGAPRR